MKEKLAIMLTTLALTLTAGEVFSSDDDANGGKFWHKTPDVAAVSNDQYREECGSCHMAYPPGLLPAASWKKLMANLGDHFGDNAELGADVNRALSAYLTANSADHSTFRRSQMFARSAGASAPMRITEVAYFRREHHELPARAVKNNPKVGSFSNCNACHQRAEAGSFREREIRIPGYDRWDD